ncbi:MAG: hypothetical protein NTZ05_12720, partial [Chloroflexi bacterium]|nr:hypothetical protein [Chloroflexota bacterium]
MRVGHLWRLLAVVIMVLSSIGRADLAAAGDPGLPPPPAPSKSGAPKLDGTLIAMTRAYETGGMAAATQEAGSRNVGMPAPGQVRVVVEAAAKGQDAAAAAIKAAGGVVAARYQGLLAASVPVASMKLLTGEASVSFIRLPAPHHADVTSEGLARVDAARWHTAGQRGQGVKVAIVDLGFKGYETKLGGELPGSVITRCFCSDGVGIGGFCADGSGEV